MTDKISAALQGRRYAHAVQITQNSPAILTNGHEIDPSEILPRFLAAESNGTGEILAFHLVDSLDDAAEALDLAHTPDVQQRQAYDLDDLAIWVADLRTVGFNRLVSSAPDRFTLDPNIRVDIKPAELSSIQPGVRDAKVLVTINNGVVAAATDGQVDVAILDLDELTSELTENGRKITLSPSFIVWLQSNHPELYARLLPCLVESPTATLDAEMEAGNRASQELARHMDAMGTASFTHTVETASGRFEVFGRKLSARHSTAAVTEEAPVLALTLNDRQTETIIHALRTLQYNALALTTDSCNGAICHHFTNVDRLDPYELSQLADSIRLDSLVLVV